MNIKIETEGAIPQLQLLEVHQFCKKYISDDLSIKPKPRVFAVSLDVVSTASSVVSTLVAIISLLYQINQNPKKEWTFAKLQDSVETECAKYGLLEINIISITNFDSLVSQLDKPCKIVAKSSDGTKVKILVFNDGTKLLIRF